MERSHSYFKCLERENGGKNDKEERGKKLVEGVNEREKRQD